MILVFLTSPPEFHGYLDTADFRSRPTVLPGVCPPAHLLRRDAAKLPDMLRCGPRMPRIWRREALRWLTPGKIALHRRKKGKACARSSTRPIVSDVGRDSARPSDEKEPTEDAGRPDVLAVAPSRGETVPVFPVLHHVSEPSDIVQACHYCVSINKLNPTQLPKPAYALLRVYSE